MVSSTSTEAAIDRLSNRLIAALSKLEDSAGAGRLAVEQLIKAHESLTDAYRELLDERNDLASKLEDEQAHVASLTAELENCRQGQMPQLPSAQETFTGALTQAVTPAPLTIPAPSREVAAYVRPIGGPDDAWSLFVESTSGGWLTLMKSESPDLAFRRHTGETPLATFSAELAPEIYDSLFAACQALEMVEPGS